MRLPAAIALTCLAALPAGAETVETPVAFDVRFRGLTVAAIAGLARETPEAYAANLRVRATGLASVFARIRFDMRVEGFRDGGALTPFSYREIVDTGQRASAVELLWPGGSGPVLLSQPPVVEAGLRAVTAEEAEGAQDRLTLLWRLARPQPAAELCDWHGEMFDGARLAALAIGPPRADGDGIVCEGAYIRRAGFPPAELAQAPAFPLRAAYRPRGDGLWELTEVQAASIYGPVRIIRRD